MSQPDSSLQDGIAASDGGVGHSEKKSPASRLQNNTQPMRLRVEIAHLPIFRGGHTRIWQSIDIIIMCLFSKAV